MANISLELGSGTGRGEVVSVVVRLEAERGAIEGLEREAALEASMPVSVR